ENELTFVLAHEVFHLALRTHDRAVGSDPVQFNYAHDYIINDILRGELGFAHIPAGGLDWPGARRMSAEEILLQMEKNPSHVRRGAGVWVGPSGPSAGRPKRGTPGAESGQQGSGQGPDAPGPLGDVLDDQLEREWFPDADPHERRARAEAVRE